MSSAKKAMHILMTADTVGGVWNYALQLSAELAKNDVQVSLATMGPRPSSKQLAESATIPGLTLFPSEFKLEWMEDAWDDVHNAGVWLLDLEAKLAPDLTHLNGYCHGSLNWKSPSLVVCHSCVLSWWQAVKGEQAPEQWDRYKREVQAGLTGADKLIGPTQAMLEDIKRLYGVTRGEVIYNARDPRQFQPLPKEDFVLTVGRLWDEAKNVKALDQIAGSIPWPIYAAGESSLSNHEHVKGLGMLSTEELARWYGRASIYALPARYEPFGLSALEAALSGCALILGDIPTLREVWGDSAIFVSPEQPGELKVAINRLIEHPVERNLWASKAGERAKRYSPERMVHEYLAAYKNMLSH